jgi:hypothetical protein
VLVGSTLVGWVGIIDYFILEMREFTSSFN